MNHQHIANKLNRIAEDTRRMDEIECEALLMLFVVCVALAGLVIGAAIEYYADHKNQASVNNEKAFAACLMGESVEVDGRIFWCQEREYKLVSK